MSSREQAAGDDGGEASETMECEDAIHELYSYLDGELTVWKRRAIGRHLDDCPPCAQGYEFEVELRQVIVSRCHDKVPEELRRRIARSIGEESGESPQT